VLLPMNGRGANLVTVMPRPAEKFSNRWPSINSVHESIFANRCCHSNPAIPVRFLVLGS
jgi:hypothetical protein